MVKTYLAKNQAIIESQLASLLAAPNEAYQPLYEAMNYSLLIGGKRIRPILTKAVLDSLGKDASPFLTVICAIELIHTYSLIHDDLPAMDDDDYRRGKLSNHKVYGDGLAILAGDGLLTYAFELIAEDSSLTDSQKVAITRILSEAAGAKGMVGGQAFDLLSEGKRLTLAELKLMHSGKTGALFRAAVAVGLILGDAAEDIKEAFSMYAENLGLLFQITDDILDVTGSIEELGKLPGSDVWEEKATCVTLLGLPQARSLASEAAESAKCALQNQSLADTILLDLVDYLLRRTN